MQFEDNDLATSTAARIASQRRVPAWMWALLAFLCGLGLTLWLADGEKQRSERDAQRALIRETDRVAAAIEGQLHQCGQMIRTFQSIFLASETVTPEEYLLAYANMRTNSPVQFSLQALAYADHRRASGGDTYVTTMFAPQEGNEAILGLEVGSQPTNLEALQRSRDTNRIAMSAPFHLRQSRDNRDSGNGFILRLPVYGHGVLLDTIAARRASIIGSLGASFRISDLIGSALPKGPSALADVTVVDISGGAPRPLYSHRFEVAADHAPYAVELDFGGRTWKVVSHARQRPVHRSGWQLVMLIGTLISSLLAALAWSLVSTRERAIVLGTSMSERFRTSEERFRKLNELLPCLVLLARKDDGEIVYRNAAARSKLGSNVGVAARVTDLGEGIANRLLTPDTNEGALRSVEITMHGADSKPFWASTWLSSIEMDGMSMWLLVASDISEQRVLTERLKYQASHDPLTGLFNRRELELRAQAMISNSTHRTGALLFLDLDQFKLINDTSGHSAGDELLVQLAAVMREKLRPEDMLGRLGGDEFGVLLAGVSTIDEAMRSAERVRRTIEGFIFSWEQRTYTVSASLGVVLVSSAVSLKELFAHADTACYLAKEAGRNRIHVYTEDDAAITGRIGEMEWVNRIREALRDNRLLLDYQELHPLKPRSESGASIELLLRLRNEDGSEVLPGAFLPAAERYGLMPLIDRWVVETVLANIDRLHPDGTRLSSCALNLSGASLEDNGLFERIEHLIKLHGIEPRRLVFEITETVAVRDFGASSALIARLRALGCRVALDDFGAGMSSFGYLKNLELDVVKIDGSFVQAIATDPMSQSIVKAVVEIGHQQGLEVVAEWVSSTEMLEIIRAMDVDFAQGFALHRPERVMFQRNAHV
ncbi:MAG: EAL domain-containing protein [Thermomonas sp.]